MLRPDPLDMDKTDFKKKIILSFHRISFMLALFAPLVAFVIFIIFRFSNNPGWVFKKVLLAMIYTSVYASMIAVVISIVNIIYVLISSLERKWLCLAIKSFVIAFASLLIIAAIVPR